MQLDNRFFHHDAQGFFVSDFHAGVDYKQIGHKQNTLIEGIRGTGKTHILKMILSYHIEKFDTNRVLPVYLSIAKLSEHSKKDPDTFRLYLYTNLVKECLETAVKFKDNLQPNRNLLSKSISAIKTMFRIPEETEIDKILNKIDNLIKDLWYQLEFGKIEENNNNEYSIGTKELFGSSIDGKFNLIGNNISTNLKENKEDAVSNKNQNNMVYVGKQLSHSDAVDFLIKFLKQLQVILDLDYTLLLIDECSEAPKEAQIEIFRLLKAIRGIDSLLPETDSPCTFFVGSVYPKGNTYYPTQKDDGFNFEPGHDFTTNYLQWSVTDKDGYTNFFKDMLHNRAKNLIGYTSNRETFISELFDKQDTFILAIYASHGIPRRFWEILKRSYYDGMISYSNLSGTIQAFAQEQLIEHNSLSSKDHSLIYLLSHRLNGQNGDLQDINARTRRSIPQNIFFEADRKVSKHFSNLLMVGVLHDIKRMRTLTRSTIPKPLFALDISIAYTLKAIPEARFVHFLKNELSRNAATNYEKALPIKEEHYTDTFEDKDLNKVYSDNTNNNTATEDGIEEEHYGTIKNYDGKSGFISPDDKESEALFQRINIDDNYADNIISGDRVVFTSLWFNGGRFASNIRKINTVYAEGVVSRIFKNLFGTITIIEDGTEAIFFVRDTHSHIEEGNFVQFLLEETKTDKRKAYNLEVKEYPSILSDGLRNEIIEYVDQYLQNLSEPVSLGKLAISIINKFGDTVRLSNWFGYKKFLNFLESLAFENIYIDKSNPPGYVSLESDNNSELKQNKVLQSYNLPATTKNELIDKLGYKVGIPKLTLDSYLQVFKLLVKLIDEDGYAFNQTAKKLRDIAIENNIKLSRIGSNFILRGIIFSGHYYQKPENNENLQQAFLQNIKNLIEQNEIILTNEENVLLNTLFDE